MHVLVLITCLVILTTYIYFYVKLKITNCCKSQTCLVNKTVIVTGANTGIGYETALDFAKRGARVILACRDKKKGEEARNRIIEETDNKNVVLKVVDLSSFASVRKFANDINQNEDSLHILVNNAGVGGIADKRTEDGNQILMQINYFSSFLLTHLLLDILKKSSPSRIVNVSSIAAKYSKFDIKYINKYAGDFDIYANSKLCNILFTIELAKKLENTKVVTFSLHPGAVKTEIFRRFNGFYKYLVDFLKHFFRTAEEGAQTTIYLSVTKSIEHLNGCHFDNCQPVETYVTAKNPKLSSEVWKISEEIAALRHEEKFL